LIFIADKGIILLMSIVEVAKLAGVSHTTVSRVLNKSGKVNTATADKVRRAMEQIGYVPKPPHLRRGPAAGSNRGFTTKNLAFLTVSETLRILSTSPFLVNLVHGLQEASSDNGLSLYQGVLSADRPLPPFIARGEVDGLIIYPGLESVPEEYVKAIQRYPVVFVLSGRDKYFLGDRVMCNHEHIGKIAAEYLIGKGRQRPVFFDLKKSPNYHQELFMGRWNRFEEVCRQAGIQAKRVEIPLTSEETLFDGIKVQKTLTTVVENVFVNCSSDTRPDGVFVVFDSLTAVLYPVLQSCGIRIGQDADIISCNNEVSLLAGLHPRPATIDLQPEIIGRRAFEQLRYRIQNPKDQTRVTLEILPKLIEGFPQWQMEKQE